MDGDLGMTIASSDRYQQFFLFSFQKTQPAPGFVDFRKSSRRKSRYSDSYDESANRMLSFYAPGWCGEIRDVIFSDNGSVTVVYRVTVRGSGGEAYHESTGIVSPSDTNIEDPVAAAEEIAFC